MYSPIGIAKLCRGKIYTPINALMLELSRFRGRAEALAKTCSIIAETFMRLSLVFGFVMYA